jgi:exosortase A
MSVSATDTDSRRFAALMAVVAAIIALYWPTIQSLVMVWEDTARTTYTHGYLIVAISLWLGWRARAELARPDPQGWTPRERVLLAMLLTAVVLAWQIAYRAGIQLGAELLLPLLLAVAVLSLFGRHAARASVAPLVYLLFAIPFWDFFTPYAQWATTRVAQVLLRVSGVPAYFQGNRVQIPAGEFEISGGCSGLHYMIVALALAVFLGEMRRDGWKLRLRWCVIAFVAALIVNWLRVFVIILAGHLTHMEHYLVRESHYGFGWVMFLLVIITLFAAERRAPPPAVLANLPAHVSGNEPRAAAWRAAAAVLISLPLAMNILIRARTPALAGAAASAPTSGCIPLATQSDWTPRLRLADRDERRGFVCDGVNIESYSAWYREQYMRKKLDGYDNHIVEEGTVVSSEVETVNGRPFHEVRLEDRGQSALLWISYRVAEREFTNPVAAQFWYSFSTMLTLRSPVSLAVAARARCAPDCGTARAAFVQFANGGGIP